MGDGVAYPGFTNDELEWGKKFHDARTQMSQSTVQVFGGRLSCQRVGPGPGLFLPCTQYMRNRPRQAKALGRHAPPSPTLMGQNHASVNYQMNIQNRLNCVWIGMPTLTPHLLYPYLYVEHGCCFQTSVLPLFSHLYTTYAPVQK